jgi:hypothetical protein
MSGPTSRMRNALWGTHMIQASLAFALCFLAYWLLCDDDGPWAVARSKAGNRQTSLGTK